MLRKETVTADTLELLKVLTRDEKLADFFLVGGTALSLQIGHRISIDIDLFSVNPFDQNEMLSYLESKYDFRLDFIDKNTLKGQINQTKTDLITHPYAFVTDLQLIEGIRIASLKDISAMKLNAISGNGTRLKDFIDIAFLSRFLSLTQMMDAYEDKYATRNPVMILKSLLYHRDINFDENIQMMNKKYSWKLIEIRLREMEKSPNAIFEKDPV
jgi:hypothetical protein